MKLDISEEVFWIAVWTLVASFLLSTIVLIGHYSDKENKIIADLIKQGENPIELACLYKTSNHTEAMCTVLISKEENSD